MNINFIEKKEKAGKGNFNVKIVGKQKKEQSKICKIYLGRGLLENKNIHFKRVPLYKIAKRALRALRFYSDILHSFTSFI